eukprot:COSAG02_NODE_2071_length_9933_cov_5.490136_5_plen_107_part_00
MRRAYGRQHELRGAGGGYSGGISGAWRACSTCASGEAAVRCIWMYQMLPCHRRLLIHSRARSRATGGPGGGGDLAALRLLSHDTDVDAWGTCWCSDMHLDPFDACD